MNLRCFYCQTPFTLGRPEMLAALQRMDSENLNHYDAHCPRCRRANSVSRERIEMFFPNWRQVAEEQAANSPELMSTASTEPGNEEPMPTPTTPEPPMEEPTMEPEPEPMKPAVKKHARKRSGAAKKTKPAVAKKTTAKAAKKPAKAKAKTASKSKAKAKPAAKKKTASKKKKK